MIFFDGDKWYWIDYFSGRSELNNILKEREERVKRVRQEQEAERIRKAEEWKQQVSISSYEADSLYYPAFIWDFKNKQ